MRGVILLLALLCAAVSRLAAGVCPNEHEVAGVGAKEGEVVCSTCGAVYSREGAAGVWKYESADLKSFRRPISERVRSFVTDAPGEPMEEPVYHEKLSEGLETQSEGVQYFVVAPMEKVKEAVGAWLKEAGIAAKYHEVALLQGRNPAYVLTWNSGEPDVVVIVNYRTDDGLARVALTVTE